MNIVFNRIKQTILTLLFLAISMNSYAVIGRVMIFAVDKGELKVLLAKQDNYWNDWSIRDADSTKITLFQNKVTQELALSSVVPQCEEVLALASGDLVYAKEVRFKPGSQLFGKVAATTDKSIKKEDLIWILVKDIQNISSTGKPERFSTRTNALEIARGITNNINHVLTQANIQKQSQGDSFPSTPIVASSGATSINPLPLPLHIPTPAIPFGTPITFSRPVPTSTHHAAPFTVNWSDPRFIRFYESGQQYYEFTNFGARFDSGYLFIDNHGNGWYTSEQYYQAHKFDPNSNDFKNIKESKTPREAFGYAQSQKSFQRSDWQLISLQVMLDALFYKFSQNLTLRQLLMTTTGLVLVEDAGIKDAFFGAGADYNGCNHLGRMLMFVRSKLEQGIDLRTLIGNPASIQEYKAISAGPMGIITYCGNIQ